MVHGQLKGMTVPEIEPFELSKRLLNLLFGFTMTKHIATHVFDSFMPTQCIRESGCGFSWLCQLAQ